MIDDVFAVIADSTRRQILQALSGGARPVGELVEELGISQPTVSKHLKVLRNVGLVKSEAAGQKRFYTLTPEPLTAVTEWVVSLQAEEVSEEKTAEAESAETKPNAADTQGTLASATPQATAVPTNAAEIAAGETPADAVPETVEEKEKSTVAGETAEVSEAPAATSELNGETTLESGSDFFDLGEEGATQQYAQGNRSHNAIDFTPMESFTPFVESVGSDDPTTSIDIASIPLLSAEESSETDLDVVAVEEDYGYAPTEAEENTSDAEESANSEADKSEKLIATPEEEESDAQGNLPAGYVAYTGEDETPEFIDDVPQDEPETDVNAEQDSIAEPEKLESTAENTAVETASETTEESQASEPANDTENYESRGFLASLTRWGRRRSR